MNLYRINYMNEYDEGRVANISAQTLENSIEIFKKDLDHTVEIVGVVWVVKIDN